MNNGYKIGGQDITEKLEFFTIEEQNTYNVIDSRFTNGEALYKKNGADLKVALGGTIPTSAGADYPGGYNLVTQYKTNNSSIEAALSGCRPIGIPLKDVGVGSYVVYRSDNKTYFVEGTSASGGEELPHNPQYLFFELQGAGGGGGGTVNLYSGSGGGAGAYVFGVIKVGQPIYFTVGAGGSGGEGKTSGKGNDGAIGAHTVLSTVFNNETYTVTAEAGRGGEGGNNGNSGGVGGSYAYSPSRLDNNEQYKILSEISGGSGSSRRTSAGTSNAVGEIVNSWLKPEGGTFMRPGGQGGYSQDDAGYGGGGGASAFGDGGNGGHQHDGYTNEAYGSGGGGGGNYVGRRYSGANGADGRLILYY